MNDRELLELAAKATGLNISEWADDYDTGCFGHPDNGGAGFVIHGACTTALWNPLEDDGDALRLVVKLRLIVNPHGGGTDIQYDNQAGGEGLIEQDFGEDGGLFEDEALRRAITRAAAEIGKAMP